MPRVHKSGLKYIAVFTLLCMLPINSPADLIPELDHRKFEMYRLNTPRNMLLLSYIPLRNPDAK